MRTLVIAVVMLGVAADAGAQSAAAPRLWFSVNGGAQPAAKRLNDAYDLPLYTEKEHVAVGYPGKTGALVAASAGYRVWKQFSLGLGVTYATRSGSAHVAAQLPHPFFDNTFRTVEGTVRTPRSETGAHLLLGWTLPLSSRMRLQVTAGPSVLNVSQRLVTDVTFSEAYPYDTAIFTGASTKNASRTAAGFNAGADLSWMFSRTIGAGVLVQGTHARARLGSGDRTVAVDGGGVQAGAGLRLLF